MSVANVVETVETIEDVSTPEAVEASKRKRVDDNTVGFLFQTKEEGEKNPPKYTDGEVVETFYLYEVLLLKRDPETKQLLFNEDNETDKLTPENSDSRGFVWGKSDIGHSALGYYAATKDIIAELADPKRRGVKAKKNLPAAGMIELYSKLVSSKDTNMLNYFSAAMVEQFGMDVCKASFGDSFSVAA